MEWLLPLLNVGSNFLGSLFGKQESGTENSTTNTNGASTVSSTANGTTATSQTGGSTSNQTTNASTTGDTNTNTNETQNQQGTVSRLDDATKALLTQKVGSLLSTIDSSSSAIDQAISKMQGGNAFNEDDFVAGIANQAKALMQGNMESDLAKVGDSVGAGADTNSAAALLKARIGNDAAANLSGVTANAKATAAQITGQNTQMLATLAGQKTNDLNSLVGNLLNAGQTEISSGITAGNSVTGTKSDSVTGTVGSSTQTQNQNTTTSQTQKQNEVQTGASTSSGTKSGQASDWTDFFSRVGGIFQAKF